MGLACLTHRYWDGSWETRESLYYSRFLVTLDIPVIFLQYILIHFFSVGTCTNKSLKI